MSEISNGKWGNRTNGSDRTAKSEKHKKVKEKKIYNYLVMLDSLKVAERKKKYPKRARKHRKNKFYSSNHIKGWITWQYPL